MQRSASEDLEHRLKALVRDVPDFPKPGVMFKDITPLLANGPAWHAAIVGLAQSIATLRPDKVVGIEARGFVVGAPIAHRLGIGFVPVRKPGKLPHAVTSVTYDLEYGSDTLEVHSDAVGSGERVVIIDDVLATGGTAAATVDLLRRSGAEVLGLGVLIELGFLAGRAKLGGLQVDALLSY